jgi:hydrogenase expression/formation protein HypD
MEVCGGQTHVIYKYRLREMLPPGLRLVSGPGCPVCVTPIAYIDKAVWIGLKQKARIFTFGDLMRVPGTRMSLEEAASAGAQVETVYSPLQAVEFAKENPCCQTVFLGIGFETTLPGIGLSMLKAQTEGAENFSVLLSAKRIPPVLDALLSSDRTQIDGFITPGHVTTVIGASAYDGLCARHGVPMAVGGFEPLDLMGAVFALAKELVHGGAGNLNAYPRAVTRVGNRRAQQVIDDLFAEKDDELRGLGVVPRAGYGIRPDYARFDAERRFEPDVESSEPRGCICGDVLCGVQEPSDCPLFAGVCSPDTPVGSCMVSAEGACNAAYLYRD